MTTVYLRKISSHQFTRIDKIEVGWLLELIPENIHIEALRRFESSMIETAKEDEIVYTV
jgi:hypothetical protein